MTLNSRVGKVTKAAGNEPISIVHNKIDILPFQRKDNIEIPDWRSAHRSAESIIPHYYKLYSLYSDVILDGHVEGIIEKRKDPIKNANWKFVDKEGRPVDKINQLIDTLGFEDLITGIVDSKFWGYKMMEPKFWQNPDGEWEMRVYEVPYLNMRPHLGIIAKDIASDEGIDVRSGIYSKTIMEVGKEKDLGLLLKIAPYAILKRGGFGDYALFVQVFGMPIVDAQWDGINEEERLQLQQAIAMMGSGGALIRPKNTDVNLLANSNAANGQLQDNFIKALNKEMSKAGLGSTETIESSDSSGYAQGKVHQEQDDEKHESDENFVRRYLNSRFRPILRAHGFDTKGGKFIIEGEQEEIAITDLKILKNDMKLPISDDYLYERLRIPKPENYEELKNQQTPLKDDPAEKKPTKNDPEENEAEQLSFTRKFLNLFSFLPLRRGGAESDDLWVSPHDKVDG